jgi:hypothetical protein
MGIILTKFNFFLDKSGRAGVYYYDRGGVSGMKSRYELTGSCQTLYDSYLRFCLPRISGQRYETVKKNTCCFLRNEEPRRKQRGIFVGVGIYSWRGFNTSPDLRSALCRGCKGIKPESNTTREQHTPGICPGVVDYTG